MCAVGGGSFEAVVMAHSEVVVADCLLESGNQKYEIIPEKYRVSNYCFIFTYFDKNFSSRITASIIGIISFHVPIFYYETFYFIKSILSFCMNQITYG